MHVSRTKGGGAKFARKAIVGKIIQKRLYEGLCRVQRLVFKEAGRWDLRKCAFSLFSEKEKYRR